MPFKVTKWIPSGTKEGSPDRKLPYNYLIESYWDKEEKKSKQRVLLYLGPASLNPPSKMSLKEALRWKKKHLGATAETASKITQKQKRKAQIRPKKQPKKKQLTKTDLYKTAQEYGIKGRSTMNRNTLLLATRPFRGTKTIKSPKIKTLEELSFGELRVIMPKFGLPSGGMNKTQMRAKLRKRMKERKISGKATDLHRNIPTGSVSIITFREKNYQVTVIDQDAQPMRKVSRKRMGEGIYDIQQETYLGAEENVSVMISHLKPPNTKKRKRKKKK